MAEPSAPGLDVRALDAWLAAHPPHSLLSFCDRLVLAAQQSRTAVKKLAPDALAAATAVLDDGSGLVQPTNLLVALAILEEAGLDVRALKLRVAQVLGFARAAAVSWPEPDRSVYFYWQERAGLGAAAPRGADPADPLRALYHRTHRVYFLAAYGKRRAARVDVDGTDLGAALRASWAVLDARADDGDAAAELLLAEALLEPRDDAAVITLRERVARLQLPDGSLRAPAGAPPDAVHHAAVVARLVTRVLGG